MFCDITLGVILCWCGIEDATTQKISIIPLIIGSLVAIGSFVLAKEVSLVNILYSLVPGIGMIALALFTTGKIGLGDGILVSLIGGSLGMISCIRVLWIALVLITIGFIVVAIKNKSVDRTVQMPFVPFLFIGWCVNFAYQVLGG